MECCSSVCFLKNIETCHNGIWNHSRTGMLPKAQKFLEIYISSIIEVVVENTDSKNFRFKNHLLMTLKRGLVVDLEQQTCWRLPKTKSDRPILCPFESQQEGFFLPLEKRCAYSKKWATNSDPAEVYFV